MRVGEKMKEQLQAIVTVLSLVNPAICGMMFEQAAAGRSRREQLFDATKVILAILVILVVAALRGCEFGTITGVITISAAHIARSSNKRVGPGAFARRFCRVSLQPGTFRDRELLGIQSVGIVNRFHRRVRDATWWSG